MRFNLSSAGSVSPSLLALTLVGLALLCGCGSSDEGDQVAAQEEAAEATPPAPRTPAERLLGSWAFELTAEEQEMLAASRRALAEGGQDPMSRAMAAGLEAKEASVMEVRPGQLLVEAVGQKRTLSWEVIEEAGESLTIKTKDPDGAERTIEVHWDPDGSLVLRTEGEGDTRFRPLEAAPKTQP